MKKYTVLFIVIFVFSPFSLQAFKDGDHKDGNNDSFIPDYTIEANFKQEGPADYSDHQKKEDSEEKVAEEKTESEKDETLCDEFKITGSRKKKNRKCAIAF